MIEVFIKMGLFVSVLLFLIVLLQKLQKPEAGLVQYSLAVRYSLILIIFLICALIFSKNQVIYELLGDSVSGGLWGGLIVCGVMVFGVNHWKIRYDEYGVIYTGWFSAPFVLAWSEIHEVRRGKIDKSDFFLIVSEGKQCRINDAWLCIGVKEFLEMIQICAPDCVIEEKIRSYYEV